MIFAFNVLITVRTMRDLILEYQEVDTTFPTEIRDVKDIVTTTQSHIDDWS